MIQNKTEEWSKEYCPLFIVEPCQPKMTAYFPFPFPFSSQINFCFLILIPNMTFNYFYTDLTQQTRRKDVPFAPENISK